MTSYILTEAGVHILTEAGDSLVTEDSVPVSTLVADVGAFTLAGQAATLFFTAAPTPPAVVPPPDQPEYFLRYAAPATPGTWRYIAATKTRTTATTDTPANTVVAGGLNRPNYTISLFDGIEPSFNPNGGFGEIVIDDPTEQLNFLFIDGGVIELWRGTVDDLFSNFNKVGSFIYAGITYDGPKKRIRTRDLGQLLTANLHDDIYGGTGGADGDATLAGVIKPYAIGDLSNMNIPLQQVTAALLIYQASCTPINSVVAVRDGGVALTLDTAVGTSGDFASYAALAAGTAPGAGKYATCLAAGFIRLGSKPTFDVTAGITGDKTGGTYFQKRGDIAKQIVTRAGTALTSGQIDSTALANLNAGQPATCGFYWNTATTKAQALTDVLAGCLGWWYVSPGGLLVMGALSAPAITADATFDFVVDGGPELPAMTDPYIAPRWKTTIGYRPNYFIQQQSRLAGAVTAADALLYGQDSQWTTYEIVGQRTTWPTSRIVQIQGNFASKADADTEAQRQAFLMNAAAYPGPDRWTLRVKADPFLAASLVGKTIAITSYTRTGWSSPRNFRCVGITMSPTSQFVTLILWGRNA